MKLRFFIYSSLLFITLALPVVYEIVNFNLQQQEISVTDAKEKWLFSMVHIECDIAEYNIKNNNAYGYFYHYRKAYDYFGLALEMARVKIYRLSK